MRTSRTNSNSEHDSPHSVGGRSEGAGGLDPESIQHLETFARKYNLYYSGTRLPYRVKLTEYARELRKHPTAAEGILWKRLRNFPVKVVCQPPIAHYIVDFYIPQDKLVIEIDGSQHHTNVGKVNDKMRTSVLGELGLITIRFDNTEVLNDIDGVCERIRHVLEM